MLLRICTKRREALVEAHLRIIEVSRDHLGGVHVRLGDHQYNFAHLAGVALGGLHRLTDFLQAHLVPLPRKLILHGMIALAERRADLLVQIAALAHSYRLLKFLIRPVNRLMQLLLPAAQLLQYV